MVDLAILINACLHDVVDEEDYDEDDDNDDDDDDDDDDEAFGCLKMRCSCVVVN